MRLLHISYNFFILKLYRPLIGHNIKKSDETFLMGYRLKGIPTLGRFSGRYVNEFVITRLPVNGRYLILSSGVSVIALPSKALRDRSITSLLILTALSKVKHRNIIINISQHVPSNIFKIILTVPNDLYNYIT